MTENTQSPEQVEQEIRTTRSEIDQTLEALQDRLSVGQLLDQALGHFKGGGGEFAGNLGRTLRDNPVPVLLVGAGLTWLAASGPRDRTNDRSETANSGSSRSPSRQSQVGSSPAPLRSSTVDNSSGLVSADSNAKSASSSKKGSANLGDKVDRGRDAAADTLAEGRERASEVAGGIRERAADMGSTVREHAQEARERAGDYAQQAQQRGKRATLAAGRFAKENPLIVGAMVVAAGAAIGAALPSTRREDEILGPHSDEAKEAVKGAVESGVEKARNVADAAISGGQDEAKRQGMTPKEAKDEGAQAAKSATRVVKAAAASAKAKARDEARGHAEKPQSKITSKTVAEKPSA